MGRPRVLLADDHSLLLGAFEKLLTPECDIVGQVSDGRSLVTAAQQLKPDVIVVDIGMPHLNGLEAGRKIKQLLPNIKLVFLTMNEDSDVAAEAFRAGASAYLLKRSAASELATAIREAMQGRSVRHSASHRGARRIAARPGPDLSPVDAATARSPAVARGGTFHEAGRGRAQSEAADGCVSQIPDYGTAQCQVPLPSSFDTPFECTSCEQPRVLLVDDNRPMLERAAAALSPRCVIVGAVTNGSAALEAADALQPDVVVLDISMPGMGGFEVAARLRAAGSTAAIVFLTIHDDEEIIRAAREAGAVAYVLKPRLVSDLLFAALEARAGRSFVSAEVHRGR